MVLVCVLRINRLENRSALELEIGHLQDLMLTCHSH